MSKDFEAWKRSENRDSYFESRKGFESLLLMLNSREQLQDFDGRRDLKTPEEFKRYLKGISKGKRYVYKCQDNNLLPWGCPVNGGGRVEIAGMKVPEGVHGIFVRWNVGWKRPTSSAKDCNKETFIITWKPGEELSENYLKCFFLDRTIKVVEHIFYNFCVDCSRIDELASMKINGIPTASFYPRCVDFSVIPSHLPTLKDGPLSIRFGCYEDDDIFFNIEADIQTFVVKHVNMLAPTNVEVV